MVYKTILHSGCESGNTEVVKYILSLNKIDINDKYKEIQNQIF